MPCHIRFARHGLVLYAWFHLIPIQRHPLPRLTQQHTDDEQTREERFHECVSSTPATCAVLAGSQRHSVPVPDRRLCSASCHPTCLPLFYLMSPWPFSLPCSSPLPQARHISLYPPSILEAIHTPVTTHLSTTPHTIPFHAIPLPSPSSSATLTGTRLFSSFLLGSPSSVRASSLASRAGVPPETAGGEDAVEGGGGGVGGCNHHARSAQGSG